MPVDKYNALKTKLADLNYLFHFPIESLPLVEQLLSDLVSTVTSYKSLEQDKKIVDEELRLAREEINRVGLVDNPRLMKQKNELQVQLIQEEEKSEAAISKLRNDMCSKEQSLMRMELIVSQLNYQNAELVRENVNLRARVDQLLIKDSSREIKCAEIISSSVGNGSVPWGFSRHSSDHHSDLSLNTATSISHLQHENSRLTSGLNSALEKINQEQAKYHKLEEMYLAASAGGGNSNQYTKGSIDQPDCNKVSNRLEQQLDFLNAKYRELKQVHARCGVVGDSPLTDLRESKRELSLVGVRYDKLKKEHAEVLAELEKLKKRTNTSPIKKVGDNLVQENKELRNQVNSLEKELATLVVPKRWSRTDTSTSPGNRNRSVSPRTPTKIHSDTAKQYKERISELESKLQEVSADRNDLVIKLEQIETSIASMEAEVSRIEQENQFLKKEKSQQEKAFVGISKQLAEVNQLLTLLGDDAPLAGELEKAQFKINQLESLLDQREEQVAKLMASAEAMRKEAKSGLANKSVLDAQLKEVESLLKTEQSSRAQLEKDCDGLRSLVKSTNSAKDRLGEELAETKQTVKLLEQQLVESKSTNTDAKNLLKEISILKKSLAQLDTDKDELQRTCDELTERLYSARELNSRLKLEVGDLTRAVNQLKLENERLQDVVSEKDSLVHKNSSSAAANSAKMQSLQEQLNKANSESNELAIANMNLSKHVKLISDKLHQLSGELGRAKGELMSAKESLAYTQSEKNDVMALYKQVIGECKQLQSSFSKIDNDKSRLEELVKRKDQELIKISSLCEELRKHNKQAQLDILALRAQISDVVGSTSKSICDRDGPELSRLAINNRDLDSLVASLRSQLLSEQETNKQLMEFIEMSSNSGQSSRHAPTLPLQETIQQQYALIGEMDAEQAKLIVENNHLKQKIEKLTNMHQTIQINS